MVTRKSKEKYPEGDAEILAAVTCFLLYKPTAGTQGATLISWLLSAVALGKLCGIFESDIISCPMFRTLTLNCMNVEQQSEVPKFHVTSHPSSKSLWRTSPEGNGSPRVIKPSMAHGDCLQRPVLNSNFPRSAEPLQSLDFPNKI